MVNHITVKSANLTNALVRGYASIFNIVDYCNDIILPGAFKSSIKFHEKNNNVKFLWQHDYRCPIGFVKFLSEDNYGLLVEAVINLSVNKGKEAFALIKQKAINGLSIGFIDKESSYNSDGYREIFEAQLWEISLVTFPANPKASLLDNTSYKTLAMSINNANYLLKRLLNNLN